MKKEKKKTLITFILMYLSDSALFLVCCVVYFHVCLVS